MTARLTSEELTRLTSEELKGMKPFRLDTYLSNARHKTYQKASTGAAFEKNTRFEWLCQRVRDFFKQEWIKEQGQNADNTELLLERQKNAIIGFIPEVNYFKDKIREFLRINHLQDEPYPEWYSNLVEAIFHENWGLAGIAPWLSMPDCTSAKIIGDRIYFLIKGHMKRQPQKINIDRFEQLRKALLLKTPKKRLDEDYSEVYMQSGERITIYTGARIIEGQPTMVFRKYIVESLTFEEQARRCTIPKEIIPMLKAMVKMGIRVVFVGPMRSGKTTLLLTWQMYEDTSLEGVLIQTDPEIKIHEVIPEAPIMSIIADGEELLEVAKSVRRSDADYIIVAEGRDGYAFNLIIDVASQGIRRNKTTMHLSQAEDFCYDVANKIITCYGGKLEYHIVKVAKSFDYLFELVQLPNDKSQKRLNGIYEIRYEMDTHQISYHKICSYDRSNDRWQFNYTIGQGIRDVGMAEDPDALNIFERELKKLSELFPMSGNSVLKPVYGNMGSVTNA